jgi:polyphenol oxidase
MVKDFFEEKVIAGFTKPDLPGEMPQDIFTALGKTIPYAWMKQVHGPVIHEVNKEGKYEGDGLFTKAKNFVLVVRTADCLPILLSRKENCCEAKRGEAEIGAVHMGWRSAQTGILDNLPKDLGGYKVFLGPAMRKCCFEVGDDFKQYKNFTKYIGKLGDKLRFDPVGFACDHLLARGLLPQNLYDCNICTIRGGKGLFSFRKDKTDQRILNFIFR